MRDFCLFKIVKSYITNRLHEQTDFSNQEEKGRNLRPPNRAMDTFRSHSWLIWENADLPGYLRGENSRVKRFLCQQFLRYL